MSEVSRFPRCVATGEVIQPRKKVIRLVEGYLDPHGEFVEEGTWGFCLRERLTSFVNAPALALAELRRLVRER